MLSQQELKNLAERIRLALRDWHKTDQDATTLSNLYLCRQLKLAEQLTPRQATNCILKDAVDKLAESYERDAALLESRFMDGVAVLKLAHQHNMAESTFYAVQREALMRLAAVLEQQEQHASAEHKTALFQRLEAATYENLIGVEEIAEQLLEQATTSEPPWFISLVGMGGIGKTSLAHHLLSKVIEQGVFSEIGWVSARQQHLNLDGQIDEISEPALTSVALVERLLEQLMPKYAAAELPTEQQLRMLQARLKDLPHLIVIDNLETLVDVETLLPTLQKLSNPSRFILTSRVNPHGRINVYNFVIPELSEEDALALIRQEAKLSNLSELAKSPDETIRPIFEAVGGNPLALRLVIGQNYVHPLNQILDDITSAHSGEAQNLYTYIYQRAWENLDDQSRKVLTTMLVGNPDGDDIDFFATVSDLSIGDVRNGLNHLVRLNLVDARGGINERRYSIHGLTRSFLHKDVLGWMSTVA